MHFSYAVKSSSSQTECFLLRIYSDSCNTVATHQRDSDLIPQREKSLDDEGSAPVIFTVIFVSI